PQLNHQETVRQHDEIHVPGLAPLATQLTVSQPKLLLAVPMEGLCACPTAPVDPHDPRHLPGDPVGYQDLARLGVVPVSPQDHDPHLVLHVGDLDRHREVPLPLVTDPQLLAILGWDRRGQFAGLFRLAPPDQLAVEFQITDVAPRTSPMVHLALDVVEDLGVGEIAVEGKIARDLSLADPIDQLADQLGMVAERLVPRLADLLFAKEPELQGVVLAAGADVVDEEIVLSDLVALLGMVPEPAGIGDQLTVPV